MSKKIYAILTVLMTNRNARARWPCVFFYRRGCNRRTCAAMEADWIDHHSKKSLKRLLPRLLDVRHINMLRGIILSIGTILDTEAALQLGSHGFVWLDCSVTADIGGSR
ncbi:MAG: hypothetical protein NWR42_04730 [Desulfobacterales bacterium]|nr:hypothetical protein [Desulfobacterales bacterium]